MKAKAALLTTHGIGQTLPNFSDGLFSALRKRLGTDSDALYTDSIYYQGILEPNEKRVWSSVADDVSSIWNMPRKFVLFGIADAASLEAGKDRPKSNYWLCQVEIARALLRARNAMQDDGPVLILAHSLGGQVISNYYWDAISARDKKPVTAGIWVDIDAASVEITGGRPLSPDERRFLQGSTFAEFHTTGCNIPIFVAAHARTDILPIVPNDGFRWHNYFDRDDILGWPLSSMSPQYEKVVADHEVNAAGGLLGWLSCSWNPLSHNRYWKDNEVLDPLTAALKKLLR